MIEHNLSHQLCSRPDISTDTDCRHHSCYRGRYIIMFSPDISAVERCNRACVFPCVGHVEICLDLLNKVFNFSKQIHGEVDGSEIVREELQIIVLFFQETHRVNIKPVEYLAF